MKDLLSPSISVIQASDEEEISSAASTSCSSQTVPLQKVPSKSRQASVKTFTMTKKVQTKIDMTLAFFVGTEMMPYNIVEKDGFKRLVQVLNSSYKLPSRKTLSEKLIPDLYNQTRRVIEGILKQAQFISCTTDCWTSVANRSYIALTCHFVDENYHLASVCLGCYEMDEDHTAENLCNHINMILTEWNIDETINTSFTTDYGSNVLKAVKDMGKTHVCCFGHAINIAVNKCFENAIVSETLRKIKKIQNIFAHSWKAVRDLNIIQKKYNIDEKKIPSFSKTRWWSLLNLIKTIVQQEISLLHFLQTYNNGCYRNLILTANDIKLLNVILELLNPIQNISETLSGENYVTGSTVLPICLELDKTLIDECDETEIDHEIVTLKKEMASLILNTLKSRYESDEKTHRLLQTATFMDPRFKGTFFSSEEIHVIEDIILQLSSELKTLPVPENRVATSEKKKGGLSSIFKSIKTIESSNAESLNEKIKKEIQRYNNMTAIDIEEDPLIWWKYNTHIFPFLSQSAKKFLCIQASSVPSERVFSKGGQIVSDLRASLSGDHIEQLVFLTMNKKFVNVHKNT